MASFWEQVNENLTEAEQRIANKPFQAKQYYLTKLDEETKRIYKELLEHIKNHSASMGFLPSTFGDYHFSSSGENKYNVGRIHDLEQFRLGWRQLSKEERAKNKQCWLKRAIYVPDDDEKEIMGYSYCVFNKTKMDLLTSNEGLSLYKQPFSSKVNIAYQRRR